MNVATSKATMETWDYEEELSIAKKDLDDWEWDNGIHGDTAKQLIHAICVSAGSNVLEHLSDDLRNCDTHADININDDLLAWKLSGDHFLVECNVSQAFRMWAEPNYIDNDARKAAASELRRLADELESAAARDP